MEQIQKSINYNDLTNKPNIPSISINGETLVIRS